MAGLQSSFGLDGAIGCYEDIEHADTFVLWDVNLAETDPVLFSRMLARRRVNPAVRIVSLSTRTTRTDYAVDLTLLCAPHSSLAIANGICQEIVDRKWVNQAFLERHVAFKRGTDGPRVWPGRRRADRGRAQRRHLERVRGVPRDYRPSTSRRCPGFPRRDIRWLASLYGDPMRRVMSVWGRGVNQDVRGTWNNNALYNIHLLVGKVADAREQPVRHDRTAEQRERASRWGLPDGDACPAALCGTRRTAGGPPTSGASPRIASIPRRPRRRSAIFRRLERGDLKVLWIQATDPMVSLPNLDRYRRAAARSGCFLAVSEAYPTPTTDAADLVLPGRDVVRARGRVRQRRAPGPALSPDGRPARRRDQ